MRSAAVTCSVTSTMTPSTPCRPSLVVAWDMLKVKYRVTWCDAPGQTRSTGTPVSTSAVPVVKTRS